MNDFAVNIVAFLGVAAWLGGMICLAEAWKREKTSRKYFEQEYLRLEVLNNELETKMHKDSETGGFKDVNDNPIDLYNLPLKGNVKFTEKEISSEDFEWRHNYLIKFLKRRAREVPGRELLFYYINQDLYWTTGERVIAWEIREK